VYFSICYKLEPNQELQDLAERFPEMSLFHYCIERQSVMPAMSEEDMGNIYDLKNKVTNSNPEKKKFDPKPPLLNTRILIQ